MKNDFCDLDEELLHRMNRQNEMPKLARGLLTSPFQFNERDGYVLVPTDTFKQFTDCVADYVINHAKKP
jgi:beta-lactamase regulating signal transducer with metallopeptidase domain